MLLAEALGVAGLKERIKVYATDIDEEALAPGPGCELPRAARWRRSRRSWSSGTSSRTGNAWVAFSPSCGER